MNSIKESFIEHLKANSSDNSGKPSSYAKAMQVLEETLFKANFSEAISIWNFINLNNIDELYEFVKKEQNNPNGIFKNSEPKSYWQNRYCSASIKEYKGFLNKQKKGLYKSKTNSVAFDVQQLQKRIISANINCNEQLVTQIVSSLQSKPFLILTGLSGSGKTKLAEAFSLWITENSKQICMVAVGADWTNREQLLGFPDALNKDEYIKPDNGVLDLIINASNDESKPYFLILDEMNMSHVERYFADFLSAMESSNKTIALHSNTDKEKSGVPHEVKLPANLFIIGTVNIDETTYMFSPKVLDRANVIEFRVQESEMEDYFKTPTAINMDALKGKGASMATSFVAGAKDDVEAVEHLAETFMPFFNELEKAGVEFGYRTAFEMNRFIAICNKMAKGVMSDDDVIDAAIMQKLLPKLHGSRNKLQDILLALGLLCLTSDSADAEQKAKDINPFDEKLTQNIKYSLSYQKLKRMYNRVLKDGFTNFAEA